MSALYVGLKIMTSTKKRVSIKGMHLSHQEVNKCELIINLLTEQNYWILVDSTNKKGKQIIAVFERRNDFKLNHC